MTPIVSLILSGFPLFFSPPESTAVVVSNLLDHESIQSLYLVLPNAGELVSIEFSNSIQPGESSSIRFPWGYINRVILNTDMGNVYFQSDFYASSNPDTLKISRASKEFGGIFDRIQGTLPVYLLNSTSINIASVQLVSSDSTGEEILGNNPLMPGEVLRLWVQDREPLELLFIDTEGNFSDIFTAAANPDTIYQINNSNFFHNGTLSSTGYPGYSFTVANCVPREQLVSVEAFDEAFRSILYFDLSDSPLRTWDRLTTQTDFPPSFLVCTDSHGREYSLGEPDVETGSYDFDSRSLDFDFSFPERR